MSVIIYTAYHKHSHIVSNESVVPIHVGAVNAESRLPIVTDDTGKNISDKNSFFCELTAQYWAWKNNTTSSHIGLQHYRRFLHLLPDDCEMNRTIHGISMSGFFYGFTEEIGQSAENLNSVVPNYDIVVPEPFNVKNVGIKTVRQQYAKADFHIEKDLEVVEEIIRRDHPDYVDAMDKEFSGVTFYQTNTFILKRDIFFEYSEWLFDILFKAEKLINTSTRNQQEARVFGYLSERLFNVFIQKYRQDHPACKVLEVPLIFVENTDPLEPIPEFFEFSEVADTIQLAVATDARFSPYCHVLVTSVIRNRRKDYGINIILLEGGLSENDKNLFRHYADKYPKVNVQILSMAHAFSNVYFRPPFTKETFYRLVLPELLPNHKKILYLDADMAAVGDIIELWNTNLGTAPIAAARDYINVGFQETGVHSDHATGGLPAKEYATKVLGMEGIENDYFQAGMLIMNLDVMRDRNMSQLLVNDIKANKYWFLDQDVLNKYLAKDALLLPQEWNVYYIDHKLVSSLDSEAQGELRDANRNPKIAHFAGIAKPWDNTLHPLSWVFWEHARFSPFYEVMVHKMKQRHLLKFFPHPLDYRNEPVLSNKNRKAYKLLRSLYQRVPSGVRVLLPHRLIKIVLAWVR